MTNEEILAYYDKRYEVIGKWMVKPGDKVFLGDKQNRICRFCGQKNPKLFKKIAHAVPECLGNKSIFSEYECDDCNEKFGNGIENDLGNWSKPLRTFARIRGKNGVPSIKKGGPQGWRIDYINSSGFDIKQYEGDPIFTVDESTKTLHLTLKRDPYTPVAVLKAFMKIGLTLMPEAEIANFQHLKNWVCNSDHSINFVNGLPVFYTFQPGPQPADLLVAFILRRKPSQTDCPYAFLILNYGNETFQVLLPSAEHDGSSMSIMLPHFLTPGAIDPARFIPPKKGKIDLTGREIVRDGIAKLDMGYETGGP